MSTVSYTGGNLLVDRLSKPDFDTFRRQLDVVPLASGQLLYPGSAEGNLEYVYFPIDGVTSMLATMADGSAAEAGTVGREGMVGVQSAFGSPRMLERWIGQVPGVSGRIGVPEFRAQFRALPTLRVVLQRYLQSYLAFLAQSVACNALHLLVERCARWLLLTHDRAGRDSFELTHEFLALMLGVRRPGVSVAAATLQDAGLISYVRGHITIVNRRGLEAASCECYQITTSEYERLFDEPQLADETEAFSSDGSVESAR